jgi:Zn-dependent protease
MIIIVWILAFAITITIHEAAHAWTSDRLGDPSARLAGRLSLNPLNHYDPIGTTLLLVLVIMRSMGFPIVPFGWAKPVPVDPYNLQNPKKDSALISLAGPLANLGLASALAIILRLSPNETVFAILYPVILLNVALAVFNLVPVYPLDGGKILVGLLPNKKARSVELFLNRYGFLLLILLVFPSFQGASLITTIITPIIGIILKILVPGFSTI